MRAHLTSRLQPLSRAEPALEKTLRLGDPALPCPLPWASRGGSPGGTGPSGEAWAAPGARGCPGAQELGLDLHREGAWSHSSTDPGVARRSGACASACLSVQVSVRGCCPGMGGRGPEAVLEVTGGDEGPLPAPAGTPETP